MIKFNTSSVPSYVTVDDLDGQGTLGYRVNLEGEGDTRVENGDYIHAIGGKVYTVIKAADYASNEALRLEVREEMGEELAQTIWQSLTASGLSNAQKAGVATSITTAVVLILSGEISVARDHVSGQATNANFTNGVKNALLAIIDTALTNL